MKLIPYLSTLLTIKYTIMVIKEWVLDQPDGSAPTPPPPDVKPRG